MAEALKRIEELERRVRELEARAPVETHHHEHHHYAPLAPYVAPLAPIWMPAAPVPPYVPPYTITCAASAAWPAQGIN
jgi:hypothetical protein